MEKRPPEDERPHRWYQTAPRKDQVLFVLGLAAILYEIFVVDLIGAVFHFEVILAGLALVGIPVTQWMDKK